MITTGKYTHQFSIQALLGKDPSAKELEYFSCEKQVNENTPPCFLWQTQEDELVPVENSYLFTRALREKKVSFAHYVFPKGPHGLSLSSMEQFSGWKGGEYVQEQLHLALQHVKDDTAINLSKERRAELLKQFFEPKEEDPGFWPVLKEGDENPYADVSTWPELSRMWFERFL